MPPYLCIYIQTSYRNETRESIAQNVYFVYHVIRYNAASAAHFFESVGVEVFRLCSILFLRHMWNEILLDVFLRASNSQK